MTDLSTFDPNSVGNPSNNIFGLPFEEDDAQLIILPIPWEVTVSYNAGTARAPEHIFTASLQVDLFDPDVKDGWKKGFYMRPTDKKILMKRGYVELKKRHYSDFDLSAVERVLSCIENGCTDLNRNDMIRLFLYKHSIAIA